MDSTAAAYSPSDGDTEPSSLIVVVGGGIAGAMMALSLARRGLRVDLYEKRPDFRLSLDGPSFTTTDPRLGQSADALKRSINLALSFRGQEALRSVGLLEDVMRGIVQMPARAIHDLAGHVTTQAYGKRGQFICSVSRSLLNAVLLDACDKLPHVRCYFEANVRSLDASNQLVIEMRDKSVRQVTPRLVVGADGAYSAIRSNMLRYSRMDFSRQYINHAYKELTIPAAQQPGPAYALQHPNALHIWPRHEFMMIALPNPDLSFTCTVFLPWQLFELLDSDPSRVRPFFTTHFPDALPLIPELEAQFARNPTSALVCIKTSPWNVGDSQLLIGDAAHAVVPFYGQGANAAMEDCLFFTECLDASSGDLGAAVRRFAAERKLAADALSDLSLSNYVEMRHKTATTSWVIRRGFESILAALFPSSWIPQYSMVSFSRIPYHEVAARAARQDAIVDAFVIAAQVAAVGLTAFAVASITPKQWPKQWLENLRRPR